MQPKSLSDWKTRRQITSYEDRFNRGYDWAAGMLLRGEATASGVEVMLWSTDNPFDVGARAAISKLIVLKVVVDDTV